MPVTVNCDMGEAFTCEFYADLDYDDRGWQIITMHHEAVDPEAVAAKMLRAVRDRCTRSVSGREVPVKADSMRSQRHAWRRRGGKGRLDGVGIPSRSARA